MKQPVPPNVQAQYDHILHVCGKILELRNRMAAPTEKDDVIPYLIRLCARCKSAHELLPYLLAMRHFDKNFEIPNLPMWKEAAAIADAYVPLNTESARNAPVNTLYKTSPPSNSAQREMHEFIDKGAYSKRQLKTESSKEKEAKKDRFKGE